MGGVCVCMYVCMWVCLLFESAIKKISLPRHPFMQPNKQ